MNIKYLFVTITIALLSITACKPARDNRGLSENRITALDLVESSLDSGDELVSWNFFEQPLPLWIDTDKYKSVRDAVNKAQLDYRNCEKRGIAAGQRQAMAKLEACQEIINEATQANAEKTSSSLIVIAKIKRRNSLEYNLIVAFNPETMKPEQWLPVTTPVRNNAIMFMNAVNGDLPAYGLSYPDNYSTDELSSLVIESNPL